MQDYWYSISRDWPEIDEVKVIVDEFKRLGLRSDISQDVRSCERHELRSHPQRMSASRQNHRLPVIDSLSVCFRRSAVELSAGAADVCRLRIGVVHALKLTGCH